MIANFSPAIPFLAFSKITGRTVLCLELLKAINCILGVRVPESVKLLQVIADRRMEESSAFLIFVLFQIGSLFLERTKILDNWK